MGLETRIGIVAGLVIVVVASVYFYYGENRAEEDLLLSSPVAASGAGATTPVVDPAALVLKIPASAGPLPLERSVQRAASPVAADPPDRRAEPPATYAFADRRGAGSPDTSKSPATPYALRTSPSQALTEATEKNLDDPPLDPIRLSEALSPNRSAPPRTGEAPALGRTALPNGMGEWKPVSTAGSTGESSSKPHTIVGGDTLAGLAKRYYHDERKTSVILAANPGLNPRNLKLGAVVMIPGVPAASASRDVSQPLRSATAPIAGSGRSYVVRTGDTLYRIAARELGNGARWKEILPLNRDSLKDDPKRLRPGMTIRLPN